MQTSKRAWLYPHTAERDYARDLLAYSEQVIKETERRYASLEKMRLDGFSEDLTALIAGLLLFAADLANPLISRLPERFRQVSKFNDKQWVLQVKSGTGLSIGGEGMPPSEFRLLQNKFGMSFDLFRSEPWLNPLMNNWVAENTRLIKSIPEQYLGNVEGMIRRAVQSGLSSKELAKQIEQTGLVTKNRAKLIAQDQIAKADAALTEYRQKDLGIDSYIWQTSEDSRVRPEHAAMNGKVIQWNKPPSIGHPGFEPRCRCRAKPVFKF